MTWKKLLKMYKEPKPMNTLDQMQDKSTTEMVQVEELDETDRGAGGYGSTGR